MMSGDIFHCDNTLTETERGRGAAQLSLQHIQYLSSLVQQYTEQNFKGEIQLVSR